MTISSVHFRGPKSTRFWQFTDLAIYTLAMEDWHVVFQANLVNGVLTPNPASIVSAQSYVRTHQDPGTTASPPNFNGSTAFTPWA